MSDKTAAIVNEGNWVSFYTEFANKLLQFSSSRDKLVALIKDVYANSGMKLPKLDSGELIDIDPFTVFGLFNKGISDMNRMKIISEFKKLLHVEAEVPTKFDGIPVLNNLSATFYLFAPDRSPNDISNMWLLFESALAYADGPTSQKKDDFCSAYDVVLTQPRIKWNLSMALFWVRPQSYVNLDSRNRWFMTDRNALGEDFAKFLQNMKEVPSGQDYLSLCDQIKRLLSADNFNYKNLCDLSFTAWIISEQVNQEKRSAEKAAQGNVALGDEGVNEVHYWLISPGRGAEKWSEFHKRGIISIGWRELGNLESYKSKADITQALKGAYVIEGSKKNDTCALWDFAHSIKPGDVVYAKKGQSTVLGRGIVKGGYEYVAEDDYPNERTVEWTNVGEWPHPGKAVTKTLTDITAYASYVTKLEALFVDDEGLPPQLPEADFPPYTKQDFLAEVYLPGQEYDRLSSLLRIKKNVILQGAPGVGKTFMAKRLAYSMMGEKNSDRVKLVQFHQSYSYEDFIMGYRPCQDGFELKTGVFYDFCKKAQEDSENDYFFIIDEINRGNLSKIFGELFMLIEADKRGVSVQLLYSDEQFCVPANVYVIGMMNTADRSLAMLDYALRRRFAFYEVSPAFESEGFQTYRESLASEQLNRLVRCVEQLNKDIESDDSLGRGFCIGHSYLCGLEGAEPTRLAQIIDFELVPMLEEYWFDEPSKVSDWKTRLEASIR